MFARNAEPIANVSVYRRIALNEPRPADPNASIPSTWEICDALMKKRDAERIWQAVVDTASGTNAPAVMPCEDVA